MIFWRNVLPSSSGLWICGLTDKPKDEGCTSLQIFGKKLPDHMAKQTTRSTSSTIRWWKPQNHSFHIVKNMFLYYYIFIVHCVLLMQDWLSMKEYNDKCFHNIWMSISMNIELYYFLKKSNGKFQYCLVLNIGTYSSNNMAVPTAQCGFWNIYISQ